MVATEARKVLLDVKHPNICKDEDISFTETGITIIFISFYQNLLLLLLYTTLLERKQKLTGLSDIKTELKFKRFPVNQSTILLLFTQAHTHTNARTV